MADEMENIGKTAFATFMGLAAALSLAWSGEARGEGVDAGTASAQGTPATDAVAGEAAGGDAAVPVESHRFVFDDAIPLVSSAAERLKATVCFHGIRRGGQAPSDDGQAPSDDGQAPSSVPLPPPVHLCESFAGESVRLNDPVSPASEGFHVTVELPRLSDVRVRLFDESKRLLPASDSTSSGARMTVVDIVPTAPLVPGTAYGIRIDGFIGELPTAPDGTTYGSMSISFRTDGQKPAPPPKAKPGKSKKTKRSSKR